MNGQICSELIILLPKLSYVETQENIAINGSYNFYFCFGLFFGGKDDLFTHRNFAFLTFATRNILLKFDMFQYDEQNTRKYTKYFEH